MNRPALSAAHDGALRRALRRCVRWVAVPATTLVLLVVLVGTTVPSVREAVLRPVPSGLRAVATTATSVRLTWDHVSRSPRYRVVFSTAPSMADARVVMFDDNEGTLTGLAPGRRYYLRVAAADADGDPLSDYTPAAYPSARTLYRGDFHYLAPRELRVTKARVRSLSLDWAPVAHAPGYRVAIATDKKMTGARTRWFNSDRARVGHLKPGKRYFVTVSVASRTASSPALSRDTRVRPALTTLDPPAPTKLDPPALPKLDVSTTYDLRVASWNILASVNKAWGPRRDTVVRQLAGVSPGGQTSAPPDAIALQEAIPYGQFQDVVSGLNAIGNDGAHYSGLYGNSRNTRIVWNDNALDLVRSGVIRYRAQEHRSDGLRMAPWAVFEVKRTRARFFFLSAHLETAGEGVRRAQWRQLLRDVPALADGVPVVMGGDFNSPRSGSNRTAQAMLGPTRAAGFGDMLGQVGSGMVTTSSTRADTVVNGNLFSVNYGRRHLRGYSNAGLIGQDVDYLFADNDLDVTRWEMVVDAAGRHLRGVIPSDHNMIRATVTLPTPSGG